MKGKERSVLVSNSAHREPRLSAGVPKAPGGRLGTSWAPICPGGNTHAGGAGTGLQESRRYLAEPGAAVAGLPLRVPKTGIS